MDATWAHHSNQVKTNVWKRQFGVSPLLSEPHSLIHASKNTSIISTVIRQSKFQRAHTLQILPSHTIVFTEGIVIIIHLISFFVKAALALWVACGSLRSTRFCTVADSARADVNCRWDHRDWWASNKSAEKEPTMSFTGISNRSNAIHLLDIFLMLFHVTIQFRKLSILSVPPNAFSRSLNQDSGI